MHAEGSLSSSHWSCCYVQCLLFVFHALCLGMCLLMLHMELLWCKEHFRLDLIIKVLSYRMLFSSWTCWCCSHCVPVGVVLIVYLMVLFSTWTCWCCSHCVPVCVSPSGRWTVRRYRRGRSSRWLKVSPNRSPSRGSSRSSWWLQGKVAWANPPPQVRHPVSLVFCFVLVNGRCSQRRQKYTHPLLK